MKIFSILLVGFLFFGCFDKEVQNALELSYEENLKASKNTEVSIYMWGGSKEVNAYFDDFVIPKVKELYSITLHRVPIDDVKSVLQKIELQKSADKTSSLDIIWLNGENFKIAKQKELLYGDIVSKLPNYEKYIDANNASNLLDFSEKTEGLEAPFGRAQFVMVYNQDRVKNPPQNNAELFAWIQNNPERFTYPSLPDFTGSAFVRQLFINHIGGVKNFDESTYKEQLQELFVKLNKLKPYMYKAGSYMPNSSALLDTFYAKGEVDFTFSYNPTHALNKADEFPKASKTALFKNGTLANTHFMSIAKTSANPSGALIVIDFLLSPEAQLQKAKAEVWGDGTVLDITKLDESMQKEFESLSSHPSLIETKTLQANQISELKASYIEEIEKLWEENVLKK